MTHKEIVQVLREAGIPSACLHLSAGHFVALTREWLETALLPEFQQFKDKTHIPGSPVLQAKVYVDAWFCQHFSLHTRPAFGCLWFPALAINFILTPDHSLLLFNPVSGKIGQVLPTGCQLALL